MRTRRSANSLTAADCANKLKVLADRTRLGVIDTLLDGPRHVTELGEVLRVEQSLLSHHLRVLREAGLVEAVRDGKSVLYQIAPRAELGRTGRTINLGCCHLSFALPGSGSQPRELRRV
jgi:ArsR family transcriptional regulator